MSKKNDLLKKNISNNISRRQFLGGMSALGIAATIPSIFMPNSAFAGQKSGGHFKLGIGAGSTTDTLDPATFADTYMQTVGGSVYNLLVEIDNKNTPTPELAESWEASSDAKIWTIKIRKDVKFHDGKALTAADVVASYNHHRGKDSKSAAKSLLKPVESIKADGDHTVVFTLSGGNADFPFIMSDYHLAILSSKDGKIDVKSGNGTGGYSLENFEPGISTKLKRNSNYWKSGRAHFDSAEVIAIKDVAARTNALTTGEIHAMDRCDLKTVHLLKRNKKLSVTQVSGNQHYTMPMISNTSPLDKNDVRLALKYAIDREALVKTVLRGFGAVGNDHPIGFANQYHAKDLEQRMYDPDKAKFHLKKAGMDSLKIDLSTSDAAFSGAVDAAVLYKEHAGKAGIEINVVREPKDGYWSNVWTKKPFCFSYWGGRPTEDMMFSSGYAADAAWNASKFQHKRFNELLVSARAELDNGKRKGMYFEMQSIMRDDGATIVPMYASYVSAVSNDINQGDELAKNMDLDGTRCIERWSFS